MPDRFQDFRNCINYDGVLELSQKVAIDHVPTMFLCLYMWMDLSVHVCLWDGAYPCVILQDKWRDVNLFRFDAGEELVQVVQVADFVLHPRHTEGGEEPR